MASNNTSPFQGVFYCPALGKWEACIKLATSTVGRQEHIGYFGTDNEAALAYNAIASLYGEPLNVGMSRCSSKLDLQAIAEEFKAAQEEMQHERKRAAAAALLREAKKVRLSRQLEDTFNDTSKMQEQCFKNRKQQRLRQRWDPTPLGAPPPPTSSSTPPSSCSSSSTLHLSSASESSASALAKSAGDGLPPDTSVVSQPFYMGETVKLLFDDSWEHAIIDRETVSALIHKFTVELEQT